jgi:hypothetical protein
MSNTNDELRIVQGFLNAARNTKTHITPLTTDLINYIANKVNEARIEQKIDTLKTCHGHFETGTALDNMYFMSNISMLEKEYAKLGDKL